MNTKTVLLSVMGAAFLAGVGIMAWKIVSLDTALKQAMVPPAPKGPPFLTISKPWIAKDGVAIVPVTDAEYDQLTNKFKGFIQTNAVSFY